MTSLAQLRAEWDPLGLGPEVYGLLQRVVRATVAAYPASVYSATGRWDADGRSAALHDWYMKRLQRGDLAAMIASAYDEHALRRQLTTSFRQWMVNARRRDSASNLFLRTRELLRKDDGFVSVGGGAGERFALAGGVSSPSARSASELLRAAHELDDETLHVIRYGPHSLKSSPILRAPALKLFVTHLLHSAAGSLAMPDIAQVQQARFGLEGMSEVELDERLSVGAAVDLEVSVDIAADAVLAGLELDDQRALRAFEQAGGDLARAAGDELPVVVAERLQRIAGTIADLAGEGHIAAVYDRLIEKVFGQQ